MKRFQNGKMDIDFIVVISCVIVFAFLIYADWQDSRTCEQKGGKQVIIGYQFMTDAERRELILSPVYECEIKK